MTDPEGQEFRLVELLGPFVDLARPYVLWLPAAIAVIGFLLGVISAPDIPKSGPPSWLASFFGIAAQVIVTLLVALALQARYGVMNKLPALLVPVYVAVGVAGALVGISPALPHSAYKWLLALTAGGGSGALGSAVVLATRAIRSEIAIAVAERQRDVRGAGNDLSAT